MRRVIVLLGFSAMVLGAPAIVSAASTLRGIMHTWRAEARSTYDMLSGRAEFDERAIRTALQTYAADAGRIGEQVTGQTPSAREFKRQLVAFQADAQTALGDLPRRPTLKADFSRLMSDCQSCHDKFKD